MTLLSSLSYVPEVFNGYVKERVAEKSAIINSGIASQSDLVFPEFGHTVVVPTWGNMLASDEVQSDTVDVTVNAFSSYKQIAPILRRRSAYSASDLAKAVSGSNPLDALGEEVASYWARRIDDATYNILVGVTEGVENDTPATDIIYDISGLSGNLAKFSIGALFDTQALLQDEADTANIIIMAPAIYASLKKLGVTSLVPYGSGMVETFSGMRVVVSNRIVPTGDVYRTFVCRANSLVFADNTPANSALEMDRNYKRGIDEVYTSRTFVMHPVGAAYTGSTVSVTNANLASAGNWNLAAEDYRNFGIRVLKSKV
jgi:hypothetical protein